MIEPTSPAASPPRNIALDYLRAVALLMMMWAHLWRVLLGATATQRIALAIVEIGQVPFFLAFGMTQVRLLRRDREAIWSTLVLFGLIGLLHGYFMWFRPAWEFFLFLWFMSAVIVATRALGVPPRWLVAASVVVLAVNAVFPLGMSPFALMLGPQIAASARPALAFAEHFWLLPGPFYPAPWGVVVVLGLVLGVEFPAALRRVDVVGALAVVALLAAVFLAYRTPPLSIGLRFQLEKWNVSTAYVIGSSAAVLVMYAALARLETATWVRQVTYPAVRFFSDRLLEATILHYLAGRILLDPRVSGWLIVRDGHDTSWPVTLVVSIANVILLAILVWLVDRLWGLTLRRSGKTIARLNWRWVAFGGGLTWVVLILAASSTHIDRVSLRWWAFAAMLLLALFQQQRRVRRQT